MSKLITLRQVEATICEENALSLEQMLAWANEHVKNPWILAESPPEVIFGALNASITPEKLASCQEIIIFGPNAEIRMQKALDQTEGYCRKISEGSGASLLAREVGVFLRDGKQKMRYIEYFSENDLEFPQLVGGRLAGILGEGCANG